MVKRLLVALVSMCTLSMPPDLRAESDQLPMGVRASRVLAAEGLKRLRDSKLEEASRIFNAGLKLSPDDASLHFLNGLTYHLLHRRGDDSARDLAATGYEMALSIERSHFLAALQLGRLQFEARRYAKSVEAFRHATDIDPGSGDAYLGLAAAAYYAHDLATTRLAVERAAMLMKDDPAVLRAEALVLASLGDDVAARRALHRLGERGQGPDERRHLDRRVGQWQAWHASLPPRAAGDSASPSAAMIMAQSPPPPSPSLPPPGGATSTPGLSQTGPTSKEPALARWTDCDSAAAASLAQGASSGSSYSGSSTGSADETAPLPALPVPCKGAGSPRMAILDVAIVRTEDTASTSHGVNLLNGLTYVFSRSLQVSDVLTRLSAGTENRTVTITRQRSDSLTGPSSSSGIAYSLNIANATDARSEVLAQPSLVALDRQSSTFFSGRNITLGIAGQAGGASTFTDKPVGVSLSVTPTFIDDDTLLVSARAARSFVEQVDANVSFGQTMQTSRNSVTANVVLKFGQTLILSGLAEQEVQRTSDGVPVLQDIPAVQYLFRNTTTQNFTRSVLVLITPRRPNPESDHLASGLATRKTSDDEGREALIRRLEVQSRQHQALSPNLGFAYRHALESKLFLQFRAGDMRIEEWNTPGRLDGIFEQLRSLLYF